MSGFLVFPHGWVLTPPHEWTRLLFVRPGHWGTRGGRPGTHQGPARNPPPTHGAPATRALLWLSPFSYVGTAVPFRASPEASWRVPTRFNDAPKAGRVTGRQLLYRPLSFVPAKGTCVPNRQLRGADLKLPSLSEGYARVMACCTIGGVRRYTSWLEPPLISSLRSKGFLTRVAVLNVQLTSCGSCRRSSSLLLLGAS
jgi:hypothetical protein